VRPAAAALLVLVLLLTACSGDDGEAADEEPTPTSAVAATSLYDLDPGHCIVGLGRNQDLQVRIVDCERRHQAEVYGAFQLTAERFPGADVLRRQAATGCARRFPEYTGEGAGPATEVAFVEVVPTLASWSAGDRRALCLAVGLDEAPLQGSLEGGGSA
jgi:hypothetical protein